MSFTEIKNLRKQGKFGEALELAEHNYNTDFNNIWNRRALAWVYYDFLKQATESQDRKQFLDYLSKVKDLELPAGEQMFFDTLVWPLNKMIRLLADDQLKDFTTLNIILHRIKEFEFDKESTNYSILISALHKAYKESLQYCEVVDWWGIDNFKPEDYLETEYGGRKIMALAEQIYINYAKVLLRIGAEQPGVSPNDPYATKVNDFLTKLDNLIVQHPTYVYPSFFKAKLLLKLGSDNIMETFIPFAKQKKNDFWVWQLMAEIHHDDMDVTLSCYCKALSLKTPEEFLVKTRQLLADLLIQRQQFSEAKTEIEAIIRSKERTGSKMSNQIVAWQATSWYKTTTANRNNRDLYEQFRGTAEVLLFQNEPEELIVISYVNKDKKIVNFVVDKTKFGFFKYEGVIRDPKIGELYQVRFQGEARDTSYRISTARKDDQAMSPALKTVKGAIRITPSGFGFVEDVFMDKATVHNLGVQAGDITEIKAILSMDKSKNEWGWKAIGE